MKSAVVCWFCSSHSRIGFSCPRKGPRFPSSGRAPFRTSVSAGNPVRDTVINGLRLRKKKRRSGASPRTDLSVGPRSRVG